MSGVGGGGGLGVPRPVLHCRMWRRPGHVPRLLLLHVLGPGRVRRQEMEQVQRGHRGPGDEVTAWSLVCNLYLFIEQ